MERTLKICVFHSEVLGMILRVHKITHFVELVEHRTKVKVGFDEKMLSAFPKYLFFSYLAMVPCHMSKVDLVRTGKLHLPSRTGVIVCLSVCQLHF